MYKCVLLPIEEQNTTGIHFATLESKLHIRPTDPHTQRPVTAKFVAYDGKLLFAYIWPPDNTCAYWTACKANATGYPTDRFNWNESEPFNVKEKLTVYQERQKQEPQRELNQSVQILADWWARNNISRERVKENISGTESTFNVISPGLGCLFLYSFYRRLATLALDKVSSHTKDRLHNREQFYNTALAIKTTCDEKHNHESAWH